MVINGDEADRDLINRLVKHEHSALAEFFQRFQQPLFGYLYRYLGTRELAEDVLQEVMLVVWQQAHTFSGNGKVRNWVFSIAHHRASLTVRRQMADHAELDASADLPDGEPMLEEDAIRKATADQLVSALSRLPAQQREVLELAFYQDFSCKQIADILGVPQGTVKSRLSYARRALRAVLGYAVEKD